MATQMRIKVRVADLIAAIEKRRDEQVEEHAEELRQYPAKLSAWQMAATAKLSEWSDCVAAGKQPDNINNYQAGFPSIPPAPRECSTSAYDRDIATLRMAAEDVIAITAEDYARYVR